MASPKKARLEAFGERLRYYRELRGFSQSSLARAAGAQIDRTSIHRYEAGENWPRPETLKALAKALEVTITDLRPLSDPSASPCADTMTLMEVGDGVVPLTLDKLVSYETALEVLRLVRK